MGSHAWVCTTSRTSGRPRMFPTWTEPLRALILLQSNSSFVLIHSWPLMMRLLALCWQHFAGRNLSSLALLCEDRQGILTADIDVVGCGHISASTLPDSFDRTEYENTESQFSLHCAAHRAWYNAYTPAAGSIGVRVDISPNIMPAS